MRKPAMLILCMIVLAQVAGYSIAAEEAEVERALLASLKSTQYSTRIKAIASIRSKQSKPVVDELLRIAENQGNSYVRAQATHALGFSDDPRIVPFLRKSIKGTSSHVAKAACEALGRTKHSCAFDTLLPLLKNPSQSLAGRAALGLGHLGDQRAFPEIQKQFEQRTGGSIHFGQTLVCLDEKRGLEYLCKALRDNPRPQLSEAIVAVLKRNPCQYVRESMAKSLQDAKFERLYAVQVLGEVGDRSSVAPLCRFYEKTKYTAALTALGEIGDTSATKTLLAALQTNHRGDAARALGLVGGDKRTAYAVADALNQTLTQKNGEKDVPERLNFVIIGGRTFETLYLIEALGRLGEPSTIATLIPCLEDSSQLSQDPRMGMLYPFPWNTPINRTSLWAINRILAGENDKAQWEDSINKAPRVNHLPKTAKLKTIAAAEKWWTKAKNDPKFSRQKSK